MKSTQECIDILKEHTVELKQYGISSLKLFGSVARGQQHEGSDVDVFVEMPPKFLQACAAADYMEDILGSKVDMIRHHENMNPVFLKQISRDGISIF